MNCTKQILYKYRYLILILLFAMLIRVIACFWGYPFQLHSDEHTIVDNAIDIITKKSIFPNVYNRPDHFEIKCCAVIFQIFSYLVYGVSSNVAFSNHIAVFYTIARMFTAVFGVIAVFLSYIIAKRIDEKVGLLSALLTCCYPMFIVHSAYATPDMVLTAFILAVTYFSIRFLEEKKYVYIYLSCLIIGVGITVKYTCAICCLWIAILVIYDSIKNNKLTNIITKGIICICIIIIFCFIAAPNLFINWQETMAALIFEGRSTHLGADGLNPLENLFFYLQKFLLIGGIEMTPFIVAGVINCIKNRKPTHLCMFLGFIYLVCISLLSLHWERWGIPVYAFILIIESIGIYVVINFITKRWIKNILITTIIVLQLSSAIIETYKTQIPDTRTTAYNYCVDNNINKNNTIYDGYTPLNMNRPLYIKKYYKEYFVFSEQYQTYGFDIPSNIEYIIVSSDMYKRYYNEPDRYYEEVQLYDEINKKFNVVYSIKSNFNITSFTNIGKICKLIKLLTNNEKFFYGPDITIYRVK